MNRDRRRLRPAFIACHCRPASGTRNPGAPVWSVDEAPPPPWEYRAPTEAHGSPSTATAVRSTVGAPISTRPQVVSDQLANTPRALIVQFMVRTSGTTPRRAGHPPSSAQSGPPPLPPRSAWHAHRHRRRRDSPVPPRSRSWCRSGSWQDRSP